MPRKLKSSRSVSIAHAKLKSTSASKQPVDQADIAKPHDIIAGMKPALRSVVAKLKTKLKSLWANDSLRRYAIATVVRKVRVGHRRYGAHGVEQLQKALGIDAKSLYRWAGVVDAWPTERSFRKFVERLNKHGLPMTWSHAVELSKVGSCSAREKLVEEVLRDALSASELRTRIESEKETMDGQKPMKSAGAATVITKGTKSLEAAVESLAHLPDVAPSASLVKQLDSLRALCETAMKKIDALLAHGPAPAQGLVPAPSALPPALQA